LGLLDQAKRQAHAPVVPAAQSLGCIAIAWWRRCLRGFAPAPQQPLPFRSIVVAFSGERCIVADRACSLAASWGSHFVDAGAAGHLNAASGLGHWPEGQDLLDRVAATLDNGGGHSRPPGGTGAVLAASVPIRKAQPHYR